MAATCGTMDQFKLPHTGIEVGFPKAHGIRPSGDRRPGAVTPDWQIPLPIVTGSSDTVLEELVSRIRAN